MTITINGPDGSTFNFPDDTAPETIRGAMQRHYGPPQAAAPQAAPSAPPSFAAAAGASDPNDPRFSQGAMDVKQVIRGVPVLGPAVGERASAALSALAHPATGAGEAGSSFSERYAKNLDQEAKARQAYEATHPGRSTALQMGGGTAAFALAPEAEALAFGSKAAGYVPKMLGMTGRLATAAPLGAATGAGIGAADAAVRGEDPKAGAIQGALTGAGGVMAGKAAGMVYDAARGMFRPAAPQRFLPTGPVAGVDIPVSESQASSALGAPDIVAAREEERMRKMGVPTAVQADQATNNAMRQAHANLSAQLDPTGQSAGVHPLDAGEAAAGDLVAQEQARAAAEVARMTGARADTGQIRQALAAPAAPLPSVSDVGDAVSQSIANRFTQARQGVNANYQALANVPGEFNPRYLLNAGETRIRPALDDPSRVGLPRSERVYVKPDLMPQTAAALQDIDHEMGQLALTNEVARGNRPITSRDIEEVRKILVQRQQAANQAARTSGNWQDVRGMRRLMQEFDRHMLDVVTAPGGFSGDAQAYMDVQQAARASHANMRQLFSRQGAGDKVGTFMENVIGKFPGQEMSPDKITSTIMGSPDRPGSNEAAVPILNHLRDNVFGPNSPEWGQIKQGMVAHLTSTPPGAEPVPLTKLADRIERFLGNERHAGAILNPQERAELQAHADNMRAAPDIAPAAGTVEQKIAQLSGRTTGQPGTGQQLLTMLFGQNGPQLAAELRNRLPADIYNQLRQGVFQRIAEAPSGMIPWEHQKTGQQIAKFLNTPLAREMFSPNELAMMKGIADAHLALVPVKGAPNPSGTAAMMAHMARGMRRQLVHMIGLGTHGIHGLVTSAAINRAWDEAARRAEAREAERLFIGRHPPLPPSRLPQRIGATIAPALPLRDQSPQ